MRSFIVWRRESVLCALLLVTALALPLSAAQHWINVRTPHFEMYTTNSEKQATRALQVFEQVRYFFLENSKNKVGPEGRVRIIAFSSEKDYKPYRLNGGAFAYYLQSRARDYIVMQDIESQHHQAAVHEYTHLIVQHTKMELPTWLNEGLADLYSSLEPHGQQAMVGRPLEGRQVVLAERAWMPWDVLFAVDQNSPYYNESDKMSIFYSQSWVLTHMLNLGAAYRSQFPKFLTAVAGGMSTADALQKIYGKSVGEIGVDVRKYVRQSTVTAAVFDVTLPKSSLEPEVSDLPDFDVELALANLLASKKATASEAQRRLTELGQQYPKRFELQESLGYLAWQQDNVPEARRQFGLAIANGSKNVDMMLDYVALARGSDIATEKLVDTVHAAIALEPDNRKAKIRLAELELQEGHFSLAYAAISQIHSIAQEEAFEFFSVSAYCRANLKDLEGAKQAADRASKYAKTPEEKFQIDQLLQQLTQATETRPTVTAVEQSTPATTLEPPTAPERRNKSLLRRDEDLPQVAGKTKTFECGKGQYRLHLQAGDRELVFKMENLDTLVVRGIENLQWTCGALKPQSVTVVYRPSDDPKVSGTVQELIF